IVLKPNLLTFFVMFRLPPKSTLFPYTTLFRSLPFFDTQLAAAMVGYGLQAAYGQLVQKITGKKLDKSHTYTNWSQRPLTQEQIKDRKSTRLNSSHVSISYAVFCLKKKNNQTTD